METRRPRRSRFTIEALENRVALSHAGAAVEDGVHRHRGGHAEVRTLRHGADDGASHDVAGTPGADDPANHDAHDDKGAGAETVHRRGRHQAAAAHGQHRGADDPAGHR